MTDFRITTDENQWILSRVRILGQDSKAPGTERLIPLTYHPTLEQAVRAASERVLHDLWPRSGIVPAEVPVAVHRLLPRLRAALEKAADGLS